MENFYIIIVGVLFVLAISDLYVGVANDAVNFLNSAIGSKAAPRWLILFMASLGVLIGAAFSNGMMEVARKGIFNPEMFYFPEIMILFLGVMITDVIMLDAFNTLGLPTSTTVSLVFELLGAAIAVAIVKIKLAGGSIALELAKYINSEKALAIITGILISVIIAFTVGTLIQYITRILFSFKFQTPMKYFGSLFGGLAITVITYFILVKGISDSSFADIQITNGSTLSAWINENTSLVLLYSFIGWAIVIQLLRWVFRIDILKIVVLAGTFALAMSFAGNDLVNFIGVPVAGFISFKAWIALGATAPETFSMGMLANDVDTPGYMLVLAGLIMVTTLIFSRKARIVTATEVNLARQFEGTEKFESSVAARLIVKSGSQLNNRIKLLLPKPVLNFINSRFEPVPLADQNDPDPPSFDMLRASVNLVISSALIAFGTSLKLPLSTTFVTFMVAMGTSLADRSWDRDSAVFRVSGVITVIGGWFFTAVIAFTGAAIIATLISVGGKLMIIVFMAIAVFTIVRTNIMVKKHRETTQIETEDLIDVKDTFDVIISKSQKQIIKAIVSSNYIVSLGIEGFLHEDGNKLKLAKKSSDDFLRRSKRNKEKCYSTVQVLTGGQVDSGHFYLQMMNHKREMAHAAHFMLEPIMVYSKNNHKPFVAEQYSELNKLVTQIDDFFNISLATIKEYNFDEIENISAERDKLLEVLAKLEKNQIKRIKNKDVNSRNSILFFKIIAELKALLLHTVNMIKSERDFVLNTRKPS
jgi:phosphate/sulfate permease